MDITLDQLAENILSIARVRRVDDELPTLEQVKMWINDYRSIFIRNELNKHRAIDDDYIQDLGCVKLIQTDPSDCGVGCVILRTENKIPKFVITHSGLAITRVGPVDHTRENYTLIPFDQIPFAGSGRFAARQTFAYYLNGYIYIRFKSPKLLQKNLKYINIRGVFEDPAEVAEFTDVDGNVCYCEDTTFYPVKKWMSTAIMNIILQERFGIIDQTPRDTINDGVDVTEV
jgi:hypothetical protein